MFPQLGPMEMIVVMGVAVLLFGKRLPEVGRSLGKGIIEFKKGLRGIEDEFDFSSAATSPVDDDRPARRQRPAETPCPSSRRRPAGRPRWTTKFEPPDSGAMSMPHMEYGTQPTQD